MADIISDGIVLLERLGARRPIAMRSGNLRSDRALYRAMHGCGLRVASNLGVGWWRPAEQELDLWGGRNLIEGVLEVPVLTYRQFGRGRRYLRLLTTSSASAAETASVLWRARTSGVPTVVLLTHTFEFVKGNRLDPSRQRPNRINKRRMERICALIADNPREFTAVSFAQAAPAWLAAPPVPPPSLTAPLLPVLSRIIQNGANELIPGL